MAVAVLKLAFCYQRGREIKRLVLGKQVMRKNTTDSGPCPLAAHGSSGVEIIDVVS